MAAEKPTDFKKVVEDAQRTVAEMPDWVRRNRDAVHVPVRSSEERERESWELHRAEQEFGLPLGRSYINYVHSIRNGFPEFEIQHAEEMFAVNLVGVYERGTLEEKQKAKIAELRVARFLVNPSHEEPPVK